MNLKLIILFLKAHLQLQLFVIQTHRISHLLVYALSSAASEDSKKSLLENHLAKI